MATIKKIAIFDIDGCISDDRWRLGKIKPDGHPFDRFKEYHDQASRDKTLQPGRGVLCGAAINGWEIALITARPDYVRYKTLQWFYSNFPTATVHSLRMRSYEDEGVSAVDIKRAALSDLKDKIGQEYSIVAAYDDRPDIIKMYLDNGITGARILDHEGLREYKGQKTVLSYAEPASNYWPGGSPVVQAAEISKIGEVIGRDFNKAAARSILDWAKEIPVTFTNPGALGLLNDDGVLKPIYTGARVVGLAAEMLSDIESSNCIISGKIHKESIAFNASPPIKESEVDACIERARAKISENAKKANLISVESVIDANVKVPARTAADILEEAGATFRERNAVYRDNAEVVGKVMAALFPNGVRLATQEDHKMYHLFELVVVKLTRFTQSGLTHTDSIHDLAVYAAMCENLAATHNIKFD